MRLALLELVKTCNSAIHAQFTQLLLLNNIYRASEQSYAQPDNTIFLRSP